VSVKGAKTGEAKGAGIKWGPGPVKIQGSDGGAGMEGAGGSQATGSREGGVNVKGSKTGEGTAGGGKRIGQGIRGRGPGQSVIKEGNPKRKRRAKEQTRCKEVHAVRRAAKRRKEERTNTGELRPEEMRPCCISLWCPSLAQ
jgi:hypothetical protein